MIIKEDMGKSTDLEALAYEWIKARPEEVDTQSDYYCQTRDVFQTRLDRMMHSLLREGNKKEGDVYIVSAVIGEVGNNSFDHNLGNWPDIMGVFFGHEFSDGALKIVLVDRGRGVFATLKKVKPELKNDAEALETAFLERISGRAPEKRGNGLKFVKEIIQDKKMHLTFISGNARANLNEKMEITEIDDSVNGCFSMLSF